MSGGFGGRAYEARGHDLRVCPLETERADGSTGLSLGFPVATLHDCISNTEATAQAMAEYLSCPKRAAAPDLYEALEAIAAFDAVMVADANGVDVAFNMLADMARAALAKVQS